MLLYYITDRNQFAGSCAERRSLLLDRISEAAEAGVDWIQLREKDLGTRALAQLATEALRRIEPHRSRTKLLINSRLDVALAVGADGVHLAANDLTARQVRSVVTKKRCDSTLSEQQNRPASLTIPLTADVNMAAENFLVGISCHTLSEVQIAGQQRADFVVLAPIFEKILLQPEPRQPQQTVERPKLPGIGCDAVREAAREGNIPILALGGVNLSNAAACLEAGAAGIAAIRLFQEGDLADTVRRLRALG